MSFLRQRVFTLLLLLLIYSFYFVSHSNVLNQNKEVLGANKNVYLFIQPQSGKTPILDAINGAEHEVLAEVYLFSDKDIISAFCNARKKGLAVNVMLEKHPFAGGNLNPKTKETLQSCDISVNWTNSEFLLTHEKTILIDNKKALILNQNLTAASFSKNREYDIIDTNLEDITQLRQIFLSDWKRESFSPGVSHLIISPNNSRSNLLSLIKSSTKSLDIEIEDINDSQIVSALIEKSKTTNIRIISPTVKQISSNLESLKRLSLEGVSVKILSNPYIHAKLILTENKAYLGSINLSSQSLDKNREVGIIISETSILQNLKSIFEKDWISAKAL